MGAELGASRQRHRKMLDSMYEAIKHHLNEEQQAEILQLQDKLKTDLPAIKRQEKTHSIIRMTHLFRSTFSFLSFSIYIYPICHCLSCLYP